ncbi:cytoplasmic dynein 2 light intermediate chain 1 [Drosophila takahashii]|uniref:cytoplasmic dynein 2 light intermediate chain 1 n=1 Tax=Drosophila takahashii TaxID=29030 RepID=UPI001CF8333B|nr:cytoplasmic dynein 2 light intermediate chain 1 [Drosophila takahashii]
MRLPQIFHTLHKRLQRMFEKSNEGGESATPSIQDIAGRLAEEQQRLRQLEATTMPKERTLLVLGSKCVGKTTAINKFFDREEHATRPTLALEYSFGRRIGSGKSPQVMNVWELGSLDNAEQLLEVPIKTHGLQQLAVFIMLDLSQPQRFWTDLECAYKGLRDTAQQMMQNLTPDLREILEQRTMERVGQHNKEELGDLEALPFPVVIVGGKYDIFSGFDPAIRKHTCRCLRSMAHLIGGALLFYSHRMPKLAKVLRDTISHMGFGSPAHPFRSHVVDFNEPLCIWFGTDSWSKIGDTGAQSLERIGATFGVEVPQLQMEKQKLQETPDPSKDPGFRESLIDEMRSQKNEELAGLMRDALLRGKFESVQN